jgi:diphthine-ammonia ligase
MKFVALVSGGKDSIYCIQQCLKYGHELIAIANLTPADLALGRS